MAAVVDLLTKEAVVLQDLVEQAEALGALGVEARLQYNTLVSF